MKRIGYSLLALALIGCGGTVADFDQVGHGTLDGSDYYANYRYYDVWTFEADDSGYARFRMRSSEFDPYLAIEDDQGYVLAENDDGGPGWDAELSEYLYSGRTYYVIATSSRADEVGDYDLLWQNDVYLYQGPNKPSMVKPIIPKPKPGSELPVREGAKSIQGARR